MFQGEFSNNMDDKGRVSIPAAFRDVLKNCHAEGQLIITRTPHSRCLVAYPKREWNRLQKRISATPPSEALRAYKRIVISSAQECLADRQGRVLLSPALPREPPLAAVLALSISPSFPHLPASTRDPRSYFHSLLLAIPAFVVACLWGNPYTLLFSLGWLSHLFLDFFTGVIPPVYPLARKGWGIEITARGGPSGFGISIRTIEHYPDPRHDYELDVGGSVTLLVLTLAALLLRLH